VEHQNLTYDEGRGWNSPLPAHLDSPQTLVLVFAAPSLIDATQAFAELDAAFPRSIVIGCSTSGEIAGTQLNDASLSIAVARFEHTRLLHASTRIDGAADSFTAGMRLASQLGKPGLRAVFVLSAGLNVNGTSLAAGLSAGLPTGVCITGGLAGDGDRFAQTWVLDRTRREGQHVCAVGFSGERLQVGHGSHAGWLDFGPERHITRADGNVLFELDGKPALDLYKTYLGARAQGLPGTALLFPLAVRRDARDAQVLIRTILGIDEAANTMTFAGDLPQGGVARLMRANTEKLIDSAGFASQQARGALTDRDDALLISVSCVGRRLVLGQRTEEEVEMVLEGAPPRSTHVGFYSYGEIAPAARGGACELHNQTMTVTAYSEA
jgi:hypothetical protein